jgi:hypothetical protein
MELALIGLRIRASTPWLMRSTTIVDCVLASPFALVLRRVIPAVFEDASTTPLVMPWKNGLASVATL